MAQPLDSEVPVGGEVGKHALDAAPQLHGDYDGTEAGERDASHDARH